MTIRYIANPKRPENALPIETYNVYMRTAAQTLELNFLEMRWRALSLAADLDRIDRAPGGKQLAADPRLKSLRDAIKVLLEDKPDRAERVQMIFSDTGDLPVQSK